MTQKNQANSDGNITNLMKTIAYLFRMILFSISLFLIACSQDTKFTLLDGQVHSENDFKGQWLVINFWAEWCAPCIEEIPEINRLAAAAKDLNLTVIGVSYDDLNNQQLQKIVSKLNIKYAVMATQPTPILSFSLPPTLPTNYIINPDGEVVLRLVGKQTYLSLKKAVEQAQTNYN